MTAAVTIFIGLLVGTLIGMTGLGGGVLLLPILIFVLKVPPILAVGSDAVFNFVTKIGSGWLHLRKGTVRRRVVLALASGSVPGSVVGVRLLMHLRNIYGIRVNSFITTAVGILLMCIPILLLFQGRIEDHVANRSPTMKSFIGMSAIGLIAGLLVGMTSVGSGSIVMIASVVLQLSPESHGRHRHCACRGPYRRNRSDALASWQCRFSPGRFASYWLNSWWSARFASEHSRSRTLAETDSMHSVAGYRRAHALGLMTPDTVHDSRL